MKINLILSQNLVSQKSLSSLIISSIRNWTPMTVFGMYLCLRFLSSINGGGNRMVRQVLGRRIGVEGRSNAWMRWVAVVHGHHASRRSYSNSVSVTQFSPDIVYHYISNDSLFVIFFFFLWCVVLCVILTMSSLSFYLCFVFMLVNFNYRGGFPTFSYWLFIRNI